MKSFLYGSAAGTGTYTWLIPTCGAELRAETSAWSGCRMGGGPNGRSVVQETARTARTASGPRRGIEAPWRGNAIQGAEKLRSPPQKLNVVWVADAPSA